MGQLDGPAEVQQSLGKEPRASRVSGAVPDTNVPGAPTFASIARASAPPASARWTIGAVARRAGSRQ